MLIDSEQLESGRALDKKLRAAANDEIERFRSEIVKRTGDRRQAENLSDQGLLLPRQGRWDAFRHRPGACRRCGRDRISPRQSRRSPVPGDRGSVGAPLAVAPEQRRTPTRGGLRAHCRPIPGGAHFPDARREYTPYQPAQRYFLLDVGGYTDAPLPRGRNLMAALIRLERGRSREDVGAVLGALDEWLSESGNEALRRAVGEWMRQVYAPGRSAQAARPVAENRTEAQTMLRERVKEWNMQLLEEGRAEGRAEGQAEGRAEGQAELMRRMAARKFGYDTAERLAERLERVRDSEHVAEIGEWLIECESSEELLERLEGGHSPSPDGQESVRPSTS